MVVVVLLGCTKKELGKTIWIYTSVYKEVVAELTPILEKKFPGVKFEWYQAGSETVAARVNAELATGRSKADLVLTSDPFWYQELAERGHLKKWVGALHGLKEFQNNLGFFEVIRLPVAVIGFNTEVFKTEKAPVSWADLKSDRFNNRVSMGSPVESGTAFSMVAQLSQAKGWDYFKALRTNGLLSAGGNSAVLNRIETKERPVGIILMENMIEAKKRGSPVEFVYPSDGGAVWVPSPIAVMEKTKEPEVAQAVYEYFFSRAVQQGFVHGRMYSPIFADLTPQGGKPYDWLFAHALPWSTKLLGELFTQRDAIKRTFVDTVMK